MRNAGYVLVIRRHLDDEKKDRRSRHNRLVVAMPGKKTCAGSSPALGERCSRSLSFKCLMFDSNIRGVFDL